MIKIVKGKFGFWDGYKVVPKTCNDEPFSIDPDREAELVRDGIAEYMEATQETEKEFTVEVQVDEAEFEAHTQEVEPELIEEEFEVTAEKLEEMSLSELEEFAEQFNIKRKTSKKADFIKKILETLESEAEFEPENEIKIDPLEAVQ